MGKQDLATPQGATLRIWLRRPRPAASYAAALLLSVLAHLARPLLDPHLLVPYVPFLVLAGAIGGLKPGLLATVMCTLESLFFGEAPRDVHSWIGFGSLVATGIFTSLVFEELKRDSERLRRAYAELTASHAESKAAGKKLSQVNRDMRSILESIQDGFNVFDHEWRYVYVNAAAARMVHRSPEELLGKVVWEVWPHAWNSPFGDAFRRAVAENVQVEVESFYPEPLNAWFAVRCYPSPQGLTIFFTDVTARKRSEEELHQARERFALVLKATGIGTFEWLPRTGKMTWSDEARQYLGVPLDLAASYDAFLGAVHPGDRERIEEIVRNVLRGDRGGHYEAEYRTVGQKDHIVRWISAWGRVFFDEEGRPERFLGVLVDASARKRLEEQFQQAQKLESVGRLAGGVAHDFNNLLTVIMGYGNMLLGDMAADDPIRESVDEIVYAATRAEELTRQLLAFSRQQAIEPRNIALNDTIRNFEKMVARLLGEDVTIRVSLSPDAGTIRADPGQIEQVLMNLAVNARDAMPDGGRLTIESQSIFADEQFAQEHFGMTAGPHALLAVSDTGVGMPPEVRAHVFEPFFTTKEKGKGTGLGLSTVYGIVRQLGGAISLYSELSRGTTFKIFIPLAAGGAESDSVDVAGPLPPADATILLAEDEPKVRQYAKAILERQGYTVLAAEDGGVAMEVAREYNGRIHLLLADVVMPVMGGGELARQFAAVRPGTPVLCMSGYSDMHAQGSEHLIQKPFTARALLSQIHDLLRAS